MRKMFEMQADDGEELAKAHARLVGAPADETSATTAAETSGGPTQAPSPRPGSGSPHHHDSTLSALSALGRARAQPRLGGPLGGKPRNDTPQNDGPQTTAPTRPTPREGALVECRFGGRAKFYPGRIERVHDDGGTFDVLYDDGDRERGVARALVRLRGAVDSGAAPGNPRRGPRGGRRRGGAVGATAAAAPGSRSGDAPP